MDHEAGAAIPRGIADTDGSFKIFIVIFPFVE
jgi:hypothetical protein